MIKLLCPNCFDDSIIYCEYEDYECFYCETCGEKFNFNHADWGQE